MQPIDHSWVLFDFPGMNANNNIALASTAINSALSSTEILPMVYEELRTIAESKLRSDASNQTLQPTALVHEAWLRLSKIQPAIWISREHFVATAAQAMRRILIDRARGKSRLKRDAGVRADWAGAENVAEMADEQVLQLEHALQELEAADPEMGQIVVLRFYGGLTNLEVGRSLGCTERTVERHWSYAKAWLFRQMREADGK